jgi:hypothetical protein
LISVSQLAKSGYISTFFRITCSIYIDGNSIITGYENNGFYILDQGGKKKYTHILKLEQWPGKIILQKKKPPKEPKNKFSKGSKVLKKYLIFQFYNNKGSIIRIRFIDLHI